MTLPNFQLVPSTLALAGSYNRGESALGISACFEAIRDTSWHMPLPHSRPTKHLDPPGEYMHTRQILTGNPR
jgi:hypothetical protein